MNVFAKCNRETESVSDFLLRHYHLRLSERSSPEKMLPNAKDLILRVYQTCKKESERGLVFSVAKLYLLYIRCKEFARFKIIFFRVDIFKII